MATIITLGGKPCLDPLRLWDQCQRQGLPVESWFGKANRFVCPLGPDPGEGVFLMAAEDVTPLLETRPDLIFDDGSQRAPIKNLVITAVETITWGVRGDPAAARVVTVRDRRHLLKMVPINLGYNLVKCNGTEFYSATSGYTWQTMVDSIAALMGDIDETLTLPFTPADGPDNYAFYGDWYAWDALSLVLDRLGCAARWNPFTDAFSVVQLGAADASADAAVDGLDASRVSDPDPLAVKVGRVPKSVRVLFRKYPYPTDGTSWFSVIDKDVPGGGPQGSVVLMDDLIDDGTNATARDARATERAADVGRAWLTGADRMNREYSGVIADPRILPGSRIKAVAWGDVGRGLKTEVYRGEGVLLPEAIARKFRPYDPNCGGNACDATINEFVSACFSQDNNVNTAAAASRGLSAADRTVFADATAAPLGFPMPDPALATAGQEFTAAKTDAGANAVTVENYRDEPFTGLQGSVWRASVLGLVLTAQGESVTLTRFTDGTGNPYWGVVRSSGGGGAFTPASGLEAYDPYPASPHLSLAWR